MSHLLAVVFLLLLVLPAVAADADLEQFFRQYLDADAKVHPVEASRLGDYRHADRMNDLSPKARAADGEAVVALLARLEKEIDPSTLTRSGRIDFEIFRHYLHTACRRASSSGDGMSFEGSPIGAPSATEHKAKLPPRTRTRATNNACGQGSA